MKRPSEANKTKRRTRTKQSAGHVQNKAQYTTENKTKYGTERKTTCEHDVQDTQGNTVKPKTQQLKTKQSAGHDAKQVKIKDIIETKRKPRKQVKRNKVQGRKENKSFLKSKTQTWQKKTGCNRAELQTELSYRQVATELRYRQVATEVSYRQSCATDRVTSAL